ncbi:hypothetical protein MRX96_049919 [Rhipicephalus microplus]
MHACTSSTGPSRLIVSTGPDECYINEVQTCAVKYVHPTRRLLDFVACMLSQDKPTEAGKQCAEQGGYRLGSIGQVQHWARRYAAHVRDGQKDARPSATD